MSTTDNIDIDLAETVGISTVFPGHTLRDAREVKGLTLEDVSRELRIPKRVIEGIEQGDFSQIKSRVFAHGYIRSYARLINLDADPLIAAYGSSYGDVQQIEPIMDVNAGQTLARPGDVWVKLVSVLIILLLVGASWWWWKSRSEADVTEAVGSVTVQGGDGEDIVANLPDEMGLSDDLDTEFLNATGQEQISDTASEDTNSFDNSVSAQADASEQAATDTTEIQEGDQNQSTQAVSATEAQGEQAAGASVVDAVDSTSDAALAPGQGRLQITFTDDSWVEVRDVNGSVVVSRIYSKDENLDLVVDAPTKVLLGRATAVSSFVFAQKDIDFQKFTRKNITRITLDL